MNFAENDPSGSSRWPNAEWWAPLLFDLAGIQRASAGEGLLVHTVDLTPMRPVVAACWPDRPELRFDTDAESGPDALLARLRTGGPAHPAPSSHGTVFWDPGAGALLGLRYAFLMEELSSYSNAWATRADQPFRLLRIDLHPGVGESSSDPGCTDIAAGRPRQDDVVVVRTPLWAPVELIGVAYMLVERLWTTDAARLPAFGESITGRTTYLDVINGGC